MSIEVHCVQCGSRHFVNDRLAGRRVRCPSCDTAVHVPEREEPIAVAPIERERVPVEGEAAQPLTEPSEDIQREFHRAVHHGDSGEVAIPVVETFMSEDDEEDHVLPRKKRPEEEMDMTPMVDVTFLLLIFFMVTAAFSLQKSIEMPRQQTDAPSTTVTEDEVDELDMVELQVDEFGSFLVMAPGWERETPGKQNLVSALKEAIAGNDEGMRLAIKVHELAKLGALVDAMDAGTIAGFSQLEVTQVEGFD